MICVSLIPYLIYNIYQVITAAQRGLADKSHGVELNSILVLYSKLAALKLRQKNATFSRQDLFKVNYSDYRKVIIFGVDEMVRYNSH